MYKFLAILGSCFFFFSSCNNEVSENASKPTNTTRLDESNTRSNIERVPVNNASEGLEYVLEWNKQRALAKFDLKENEVVTYHINTEKEEAIRISVAGRDLASSPQIISITDPQGKTEEVNRANHMLETSTGGRYTLKVGNSKDGNSTGIFSLKISKRPIAKSK